MKSTIYLDIETLPAPIEYRDAIEVSPPGNIKKPESIQKWIDENADAARDAEWRKTSFDGWAGSVACAAFAVEDGPIVGAIGDEAEILRSMFAMVKPGVDTVCGHNVANFDLEFVKRRAVILGVPVSWNWPVNEPPWSKKVRDTMMLAAGPRGTIGLDRLCKALGIPGKDGMDGSMVYDTWISGEEGRAKVLEYCKADVERVRQIDKRFKAVGI